MTQADALFRRSDHCPRDDHDNEDIILLPDDLFVNLLDLEVQDWIWKYKIGSWRQLIWILM